MNYDFRKISWLSWIDHTEIQFGDHWTPNERNPFSEDYFENQIDFLEIGVFKVDMMNFGH